MITTGVSTPLSDKDSTTSMPSLPGILTSQKITSNFPSKAALRPSLPFSASSTMCFSYSKMSRRAWRMRRSSSIMRMRAMLRKWRRKFNLTSSPSKDSSPFPRQRHSLSSQFLRRLLQNTFGHRVPRTQHGLDTGQPVQDMFNQNARHGHVWHPVWMDALGQRHLMLGQPHHRQTPRA